MAVKGEQWVREVMEEQGYKIEEIGTEDIYGIKENLGVVIEEKDFKDKFIIYNNNLYTIGIDGKRYYQNRSQVVNYGYQIKKRNSERKIYKFIVCAFVVSNLGGFPVKPIFFRKFGTIFVVSKDYFPIWLKSLEKTYLGLPSLERPVMYMGGE